MTAAIQNTANEITPNDMSADAVAAGFMLGFLKDYLAFHLHDAKTGDNGRVVQFNAGCVRKLRAALESALRDGAECGESDIASVIAGDFMKD